jgi:hypothetical protein
MENQPFGYYRSENQDETQFLDILLNRINDVGEIIVYEQESHFGGTFLGTELPKGITLVTPREKQTTASDGSTIEVKLHQDMSILDDAPPYTFLMGIQEHPVKPVYTTIVPNQDLYDLLSEDARECLQKPVFKQNKPTSYSKDIHFEPRLRPLLVMDKEKGPIFKLRPTDSDEIQPQGDEAKRCYEELKTKRDYAAEHSKYKVELKKGDILVIYNHLTTHTRDVFEAYYNGTDRIILRTYVSDCKSDSDSNSSISDLTAPTVLPACGSRAAIRRYGNTTRCCSDNDHFGSWKITGLVWQPPFTVYEDSDGDEFWNCSCGRINDKGDHGKCNRFGCGGQLV